MPFNFPFSRYPYFYKYPTRRPYCPPSPTIFSSPKECDLPSNSDSKCEEEEKRSSTSKNHITSNSNMISNLFSFLPTSLGPLNFHPEALGDIEEPLFEMFGISLFLDDIIIICILIFLYQENVKDDMLYISLFLLLIS